jgi:hypothetical protein
MVTVPVAVWPASATILVPSAKVTSCAIAPVLWKLTVYTPAAATGTVFGSKPRSKALISMVATGAELPGAEEPGVAGDGVAPGETFPDPAAMA